MSLSPHALQVRVARVLHVALCPACFNPPAACECDPPFTEAAATAQRHSRGVTGSARRVDLDWVNSHVANHRRPLTQVILEELRRMGCSFELPAAEVQNYVNVRPPARFGEARLCAFTLSSGRVELQDGSYPVAESLGIGGRFDHLAAGDKAAISVESLDDVDATLVLAKRYLSLRTGMG